MISTGCIKELVLFTDVGSNKFDFKGHYINNISNSINQTQGKTFTNFTKAVGSYIPPVKYCRHNIKNLSNNDNLMVILML